MEDKKLCEAEGITVASQTIAKEKGHIKFLTVTEENVRDQSSRESAATIRSQLSHPSLCPFVGIKVAGNKMECSFDLTHTPINLQEYVNVNGKFDLGMPDSKAQLHLLMDQLLDGITWLHFKNIAGFGLHCFTPDRICTNKSCTNSKLILPPLFKTADYLIVHRIISNSDTRQEDDLNSFLNFIKLITVENKEYQDWMKQLDCSSLGHLQMSLHPRVSHGHYFSSRLPQSPPTNLVSTIRGDCCDLAPTVWPKTLLFLDNFGWIAFPKWLAVSNLKLALSRELQISSKAIRLVDVQAKELDEDMKIYNVLGLECVRVELNLRLVNA